MSDYLDEVEKQLVELTERGAHRRMRLGWPGIRADGFSAAFGGGGQDEPPGGPRLRRDALALAGALAVVAVVVAVVLGLRPPLGEHHAPASSVRTTPTAIPQPQPTVSVTVAPAPPLVTTPAAPPLPNGFSTRSFTAIGELEWWMLGDSQCSSPPCTAIVHTTDGGRSFQRVPAPQAALTSDAGQVGGISQLRFANGHDGFAFGGRLYATHDGGRNWSRVDLGGAVVDMAMNADAAFAVVEAQAGSTARLMRSPVGQNAWSEVLPAVGAPPGLWVRGDDVYVDSTRNTMLRSTNGGSSFTVSPGPQPGSPCAFDEPGNGTVWAMCLGGGLSASLLRSSDGGQTFAAASSNCNCLVHPSSAAFAAQRLFAAATSTTAVLVSDGGLIRTTDGGTTWARVGPGGVSWTYLGFTDPTHGVAIGSGKLYYTTDGGASYHVVVVGG